MAAPTLLDCSSLQSALISASVVIGWSADALETAMRRCVIDWNSYRWSPETQVLRWLGFEDDEALPSPDAIRWFHATRVPAASTFREGLLPTTEALPHIWSLLSSLATEWISEAEWSRFRADFSVSDRQFAEQFRRKQLLDNARWEGPFAFLIRDAALGKVGRHINFTRTLECVVDICGDFEEVFGKPLGDAYRAATQPCLVVFTQPGDWGRAVSAALNYIHRSLHGLDNSLNCNTNFNGEGQAIPHSRIDGIEWLAQ